MKCPARRPLYIWDTTAAGQRSCRLERRPAYEYEDLLAKKKIFRRFSSRHRIFVMHIPTPPSAGLHVYAKNDEQHRLKVGAHVRPCVTGKLLQIVTTPQQPAYYYADSCCVIAFWVGSLL